VPVFFKEAAYRLRQGIARRIIASPQPRPAIYIGAGSSGQLCRNIASFGVKRVFIVTDRPLVELGLLQPTVERLQSLGVDSVVFDGVLPDPTVAVVDSGITMLRSAGCDGVLAFGGGSSMDSAKVIALAAANDLDAMGCVGLNQAKQPTLPFFAIPTTAGTGSEATVAAVISDTDNHQKLFVVDKKIVPSAAALDAELMRGLPPGITAATGMDALTHAVESYIGNWSTPESSHYGRTAAKLIFDNLETAHGNGDDLAAREAMALASYYAGLAFSSAMVGYVHAISHQLGGHYGIPHGVGNAMVLPHVLELLEQAARPRLAELAAHCGLGEPGSNEADLSRCFIDKIWQLNDTIGIPRGTDAIRDEDVAGIVSLALKEGHGYPVPRFLEDSECEALVRGLKTTS
jgi:alcohol dehydrogenase class IV